MTLPERPAGLMRTLDALLDAALAVEETPPGAPDEVVQERLHAVEWAWVRALDAGWSEEELRGQGLNPFGTGAVLPSSSPR